MGRDQRVSSVSQWVCLWVGIVCLLGNAIRTMPPPKLVKQKLGPDFFKKSSGEDKGNTTRIGITEYKILSVGEKITVPIEGLIPQHVLIPESELDPEQEYVLYVGLYDFESLQVGINQGVKYGSSDLEMDYDSKIHWVEKRYHFRPSANSSASNEAFKKFNNKTDVKPPQEEKPRAAPIFEKTIKLDKSIFPDGVGTQDVHKFAMTDWDFSDQLDPDTEDVTQKSTPSEPVEESSTTSQTHINPDSSGSFDQHLTSASSSSTESPNSPTYQVLNLAFRRESPSKRGTLAFSSPVKMVLSLIPASQTTPGLSEILLAVAVCVTTLIIGGWALGIWGSWAMGVYKTL